MKAIIEKSSNNQRKTHHIPSFSGEWKVTVRSALTHTVNNLVIVDPDGEEIRMDWRDAGNLPRLNEMLADTEYSFVQMNTGGMPEIRHTVEIEKKELPAAPNVGAKVMPLGGKGFATHEVVAVNDGVVVMKLLPGAERQVKSWNHVKHSQCAETHLSIFWRIWVWPTEA